MSRSHHLTDRQAQVWRTRLLALMAVFLQVFVVQTHVHALAPVAPAGYAQSADSVASVFDPAPHEGQVSCAFCQAQHASAALPPSVEAELAVHASLNVEAAQYIRRGPIARAFSWQSRAPPLAL